ncbi:MAG: ABC transporter ATP-binding protein [Dehalococcoidia bacterium]|nr:ABC transporter ATP-binding protein [Dehalococcoidia bacterium]
MQVAGLHKSYGQLEAVRGIDLRVHRNEVFALLGPNGAGKTTTVEILEGHRSRTSGDVSVLGYDPGKNDRKLKERIGIVLQSTGVERYLTVFETVDLFSKYYPHPLPVGDVIQMVGLGDQRKTLVRRLSGGQRRRLDVAVGLVGDPELLFLDEPTTGFDPSARRGAWEIVRNLRSLGKTVLLTTHYMDEAEALADRVAIMVKGRIVTEGVPSELTQRKGRTIIRFRIDGENVGLPEGLQLDQEVVNGAYSLTTDSPTHVLHLLTTWAVEKGIELEDLAVTRPSLEDVFVELTGAGPMEGEGM